jgi:hypothetical protein
MGYAKSDVIALEAGGYNRSYNIAIRRLPLPNLKEIKQMDFGKQPKVTTDWVKRT